VTTDLANLEEPSDGPDAPAPAGAGSRGIGQSAKARGVVATRWEGRDWALVIGSGSDLTELYEQIAQLPAGLRFAEAFGDVDLVLVYRPADPDLSRAGLLDLLAEEAVERGGTLIGRLGSGGLSAGALFTTPDERVAFRAGQADALAAIRRALIGTSEHPADGASTSGAQ